VVHAGAWPLRLDNWTCGAGRSLSLHSPCWHQDAYICNCVCRVLIIGVVTGGERGIRTLEPLDKPVSYRELVAPGAIFATRPDAHYPKLPKIQGAGSNYTTRRSWPTGPPIIAYWAERVVVGRLVATRGLLYRPPRAHRACSACAAFSRSIARCVSPWRLAFSA
jgi:hypothetical protein